MMLEGWCIDNAWRLAGLENSKVKALAPCEEKIHPSTLRGIVRFQHNNSHDMPSLTSRSLLRSLYVQWIGDERFLARYDRLGLDVYEVTPDNGSESFRLAIEG
ncbi:hypothetical protein AK812_SmicGene4795 [Symbiodinium microadriaticum]|uniref:Uncharacterized protein n=1 Tax=Symbiodinium microadriaticum TaxID=2951 RepID=A0A1Q9EVB7_SYMMI|nr:hypothetical protein AK812_SmicGene4795 [Symbiodinium microadriaticum]